MKALITGASGFIGSNLLQAVLNSSIFHEVRTLGRRPLDTPHEKHTQHYRQDLARECDLEGWLPEVVFHLAASAVPRNAKADAIENNVIGTFNLLQNLRDCHVVYASSVTVYGDYKYKHKNNTGYYYNESDECRPTSIYGITKLSSEHLLRVACEQRPGVTGVSLRLCANVGKGNTHGILRDFIRKVQEDADYFEIIGDDPGSIKPFLHVDDTVGALIHFGTRLGKPSAFGYNCYNIASHYSLSAKQIAEIVLKKYKSNKKIRWLGESANWPGDNRIIRTSISKAINLARWEPAYGTSAEAIEAAIDDYMGESV